MKLNNKTTLYVYVAVMFVLTFLLTSRVIKSIKTHEFDYVKLALNTGLLIYLIIKIIKLGKIENDKTE
jgi:hypothetical protein